MEDCIFCKIIKGEIPSKKVYEDDEILAFHDISPMAPTHVVIIPKKHIASANELTEENAGFISHVYVTAAKIAKELGIDENVDLKEIAASCNLAPGSYKKMTHAEILAIFMECK